jgi:cytochrome c biogenesis protein CcmG/thiol:disulfide interchange protein DsbE
MRAGVANGRAAGRRPPRLFATLAVAALVAAAGGCNTEGPPKNGDLAPEFVLESASGAVRKLSNYRGKVVLVNLWATWCPPCIAEFPMLESLAKEYSDKGLVILAVAGDEDTRAVHDFLRRSPAQFEVLLDPDGAIGTRYGITGYPETFFVDRQGRLRDKIIGPLPHEGASVAPSLIARIEEMLKGS